VTKILVARKVGYRLLSKLWGLEVIPDPVVQRLTTLLKTNPRIRTTYRTAEPQRKWRRGGLPRKNVRDGRVETTSPAKPLTDSSDHPRSSNIGLEWSGFREVPEWRRKRKKGWNCLEVTKQNEKTSKMSGICEMLLWIQWVGIVEAVGGGKMEKRESKKDFRTESTFSMRATSVWAVRASLIDLNSSPRRYLSFGPICHTPPSN